MDLHDEKKNGIRGFVDRILTNSIEEKQNPNGFCFSASFAISIYLNSEEIDNVIEGGKVNGLDHYWLSLVGYDDFIVDTTVKQFAGSDKLDLVYIGKKLNPNLPIKYRSEFVSFNDWIETYYSWSKLFSVNNDNIKCKELFKKLIIHNLINASVLNYEIERLDEYKKERAYKSLLYQLYFRPISKWVKKNKEAEQVMLNLVRDKVSKEFDSYFQKCI